MDERGQNDDTSNDETMVRVQKMHHVITSFMKMRICASNLIPHELLDFDVVLRHKVDRALLHPDAAWARRTLDRVGAFEYERSSLPLPARGGDAEVDRKSEDLAGLSGSGIDKLCENR